MERRRDVISRLRIAVKAVKEDAFLTDRYLYSLALKYAKLYIKRLDNQNKIMRFQSLFTVLPCVELEEVDKVEACCGGIKSNCTFRRTKDKLPALFEGDYGPLFRSVTSIDGSVICTKTYPSIFVDIANSTNYKYNKSAYFWYIDERVYFPNVEWDAARFEVLPEDSVQVYQCDGDPCLLAQDEKTHIPEYLFAQIEADVLKELMGTMQIPEQGLDNNESLLKD